jgi:hypothetical protein
MKIAACSIAALLILSPRAHAQLSEPKPQPATAAVIQAFSNHDIVMFGEIHGNKQEYEWLCKLVQDPQFAAHVDDIVIEFGNSLYQKSVDRYIAGEDIPVEQVQKAQRNLIGAVGPPSPVYANFYNAVRYGNVQRHGKHQIRLVLGDPYGDWDKINNAEDLGPYVANRDQWYAQVVKDEVLSKHHHALLIMGAGHFLRRNGPGYVERTIRAAGANPYLIVIGTNVIGTYDDLDPRFNSWSVPSITALSGNWVGALPAMPVVTLGFMPPSPLKLGEAADALLYVGPRDSLTQLNMAQSQLNGTPYGKELARRVAIQTGQPSNTIHFDLPSEMSQARRPPPPSAAGTNRPPLPPPPQSANSPLPPRPPSQ